MKAKYSIFAITLLLLYMPYSSVGYIAMAFLLGIAIYIAKPTLSSIGIWGGLFFLTSLVYNTFAHNNYIDFKDILLCAILFIFLFVYRSKSEKSYYMSEWAIFAIFLTVLLSQIVITLNIEPFASLIKNIYIEDQDDIYVGNITDMVNSAYYRAGGFLGNANQCAKFCNLIFAMYLTLFDYKKINIPIFITYLAIIVLAGSRTGMIVSLTLVCIYIYQKIRASEKNTNAIIFIITITFIALGIQYFLSSHFSDMRIINVEDGIENSLNSKTNALSIYYEYTLYNDEWGHYFIGNYYSSLSNIFMQNNLISLGKFDSDIGYLFYSYGIIGLIIIGVCTVIKFRRTNTSLYYYPIFLWIISAAVYTHIKFIILFIIILLAFNKKDGYAHSSNKLNS